MIQTEENRFERELEEANRKASPADKQMLRDFYRIMRQIESMPILPEPESVAPKEQLSQPVPLRLVRQCLGRDG